MNESSETTVTRAIVNLDAIAHNLRIIRKAVDRRVKVLAVVKSDAYGHGLIEAARVLEREGADVLGVGDVAEGSALRAAGTAKPIMVLGLIPVQAVPEALDNELTLTIASLRSAQQIAEIATAKGCVAKVHCIIDTGMGRIGFQPDNAAEEIPAILEYSSIDVEGISTHFPRATAERDPFTTNQIKAFKNIIKQLADNGVPFELTHAANSAAAVNYPSAQFDMVRVGIMLYGVAPAKALQGKLDLRAAMRFETRVVFVKSVPEGTPLSYDHTYATPNATIIATIPVGYAHGFGFLLSNAGEVLVRGQRAPVVGRVCMDQTLVNVGHIAGVTVGDKVTLIGRDGKQKIAAEDVAQRAHTIPYDVITRIGKMVCREYVEGHTS
jgi:alanine racemase